VTVKTEFQKIIGFIAIGLGLSMFCFSCATVLPPKPKVTAPAPRVEGSPVKKETPPAPPKPAPVPPKEAQTVPEKPAPEVQKPPSPPSPPPAVKETKPQPVFYLHTVKYSGETLSVIALWYTGEHGNWKEIAQANPDIKPNRIFPGDEILIPEGLLKTRDPLSKEFVDRISSKANRERGKPQAQSQTVQPQEEEPKLFGPKKTTPR
jgi:hypothetical protein